MVDREAVAELEANLPELEVRAATLSSLLLAVPFYLYVDQWERAAELAVKLEATASADDAAAQSALGWVYVLVPADHEHHTERVDDSVRFFQAALDAQQSANG